MLEHENEKMGAPNIKNVEAFRVSDTPDGPMTVQVDDEEVKQELLGHLVDAYLLREIGAPLNAIVGLAIAALHLTEKAGGRVEVGGEEIRLRSLLGGRSFSVEKTKDGGLILELHGDAD